MVRAGLFDGSCCFGGEESAGASFLRHDGTVWTTDKDGPIMDLLAAEMTARTGRDPGEHYLELRRSRHVLLHTDRCAHHTRAKGATAETVTRCVQEQLSPASGSPPSSRSARQPRADRWPEDRERSGWFAARPSGTENIYKIYAESFSGEAHLDALVSEAQALVSSAIGGRP